MVNHRPPVPEDVHADAVDRGLLRYCPICDAFEQTGKRIGVLGGDRHALAEALFLRTYSPDIVMISLTGEGWTPTPRRSPTRPGSASSRHPSRGSTSRATGWC